MPRPSGGRSGRTRSFSSSGAARPSWSCWATEGVRLVLDTNVWLDWLVFGDPSVAAIKAAVAANRAEVFIDAACEAELERALGYDRSEEHTSELQSHVKLACRL